MPEYLYRVISTQHCHSASLPNYMFLNSTLQLFVCTVHMEKSFFILAASNKIWSVAIDQYEANYNNSIKQW